MLGMAPKLPVPSVSNLGHDTKTPFEKGGAEQSEAGDFKYLESH